jgi:hypothetical protein
VLGLNSKRENRSSVAMPLLHDVLSSPYVRCECSPPPPTIGECNRHLVKWFDGKGAVCSAERSKSLLEGLCYEPWKISIMVSQFEKHNYSVAICYFATSPGKHILSLFAVPYVYIYTYTIFLFFLPQGRNNF